MMNQTTNFSPASPVVYRNGILVLRSATGKVETRFGSEERICDDDLDVITPVHRHKLRYVVKDSQN